MKEKTENIQMPTPEELELYGDTASREPADERNTPAPAEEAPPQIDWHEKFLRAKADLQNFQRRAAQEQQTSVRYANADFARSLLDVVDDFERTLQAAGETPDVKGLVAGIRLIHDKLRQVLAGHHVTTIDALGQPFDPNRHEALMQQPSNEPDNTVLQEIQRGYMLHDRVLRPARVIISKSPDAGDAHAETTPDADV